METTKAAEIVEEIETEQAADIIEAVETTKAAEIVEEIETEQAADIIEAVETTKAAEIVEEIETEKAADIIEAVEITKAVDIIEEVQTEKAAVIVENVVTAKAGALIDNIATAKVVEVVEVMSEQKLVERLPEASPQKLHELPAQTLFDKMPAVSAEQLVGEVPPKPAEDLPPPVVAQPAPDLAVYIVPETRAASWVTLVGSPAPLEQILGRFTQDLTGVQINVTTLAGMPSDSPELPSDRLASSLFRLDIENAEPQDLATVHATFFVEKQWLDSGSIHKWSIELARFDEGIDAWVPFPSKRVREDEERIFYTVVIPSFSVFTVTGSKDLPEQIFQVSDLVIEPSSPEVGQEVTVSARVTNSGQSAAVYPAKLWIDDTIEAVQPINVAAGATAPFEFTIEMPRGLHGVRVERLLGQFRVGIEPTPTPISAPFAATATPAPSATATRIPAPPEATPASAPTLTPTPTSVALTATPKPAPPTVTPTPSPAASPTPLPAVATPTATPTPSVAVAAVPPPSPPEGTPAIKPAPVPAEGGDMGGAIRLAVALLLAVTALGLAWYFVSQRGRE